MSFNFNFVLHYRIDLDPETSSSFCEESDSSSIPHTPSSLPDSSHPHPHTLSEALAVQHTHTLKPSTRTISEPQSPGDSSTLKVPHNYRLSAPDPAWYQQGATGRSLSPASPRVSPAPKAMKAATPDLRIRVK